MEARLDAGDLEGQKTRVEKLQKESKGNIKKNPRSLTLADLIPLHD